MRAKSKKWLMGISVAALLAVSVWGTLAYFTDSEAVTNTFTVGKVGIALDEAVVNPDGTAVVPAERTQDGPDEGNEYHLIPGHTYIKDPTVTVTAGSEDAYVRMIVTVENINSLWAAFPKEDAASAGYYDASGVFLLQKLVNGWDSNIWKMTDYRLEEIKDQDQIVTSQNGVYEFRYKDIVEGSENAVPLDALFESFTIPGEIDQEHLEALKHVKIIINAHAIQADGFKTADAAWEKFK